MNVLRSHRISRIFKSSQTLQNRSVFTSLIKKVNHANAEARKDVMFEKLIDKKRDQLNFLTLEISFQMRDTTINLRSWNDKDIFHVSTTDYFAFKRNMGHIPTDAEPTQAGTHKFVNLGSVEV